MQILMNVQQIQEIVIKTPNAITPLAVLVASVMMASLAMDSTVLVCHIICYFLVYLDISVQFPCLEFP